jgi:hypothetical protein
MALPMKAAVREYFMMVEPQKSEGKVLLHLIDISLCITGQDEMPFM